MQPPESTPLQPRAHSDCVTVRMPDVAFPDIPRHISRRPRSLYAELQGKRVDRIDLCWRTQPPGHPGTPCLVVPGLARRWATPSALPALAEEDLRGAGDDSAEGGRLTVLPVFLPPELLEPSEGVSEAGDVKDWSHILDVHGARLCQVRVGAAQRIALKLRATRPPRARSTRPPGW